MVFKAGESSIEARDIVSSAEVYFIQIMNPMFEIPEVERFESSFEKASDDMLLTLGLR